MKLRENRLGFFRELVTIANLLALTTFLYPQLSVKVMAAGATSPNIYPLYGAFPAVPPQSIDSDPGYNEALEKLTEGGFEGGGKFRQHFGKLVEMVRKQKADTASERQSLELGIRTVVTWLAYGDANGLKSWKQKALDFTNGVLHGPAEDLSIEDKLDILSNPANRTPEKFYASIFKGSTTGEQHKQLLQVRGAKFTRSGITDVFTLLNRAEQITGYPIIAKEGFEQCIATQDMHAHRFPDRAVHNFLKLLTSITNIETTDPSNFEEDLVLHLTEHLMNLKGLSKPLAFATVCKKLNGSSQSTATGCPKLLNISIEACQRAHGRMNL